MLFDPEIGCTLLDGWYSLDIENFGNDEAWWYEEPNEWAATVDLRTCLWRYLSLITGEHNQMQRYMCTVAWFVWAMCGGRRIADKLPTLFDVDTAVGVMLDMTGQWIGIPRRISIGSDTGFFSLNLPNLGLNEADWFGPDATKGTLIVLDDDEYRLILKTRILANQWDGTREDAYDILNYYFGAKGYEVFIKNNYTHGAGWFTFDDPNPALGWEQGYWDQTDTSTIFKATGNMWMKLILYGREPPSLLLLALFTGGYFDVRPAGVGMGYYRNDPAMVDIPMFGWDEGPSGEEYDAGWELVHPYMAGWDIGAWALRVLPLQFRSSYAPETAEPEPEQILVLENA